MQIGAFCEVFLFLICIYVSNGLGCGVNNLHVVDTRGSDDCGCSIMQVGHPSHRLGAAGCKHLPFLKLTQLIFIGINMQHHYCVDRLQ